MARCQLGPASGQPGETCLPFPPPIPPLLRQQAIHRRLVRLLDVLVLLIGVTVARLELLDLALQVVRLFAGRLELLCELFDLSCGALLAPVTTAKGEVSRMSHGAGGFESSGDGGGGKYVRRVCLRLSPVGSAVPLGSPCQFRTRTRRM